MKVLFIGLAGLLLVFGLLFHFAALETFNFLVPKDAGVSRVASSVTYGADPRQTYDVYRPEGNITLPLIVFVYGGSWASGAKEPYEFAARALASKGYVVFVPDYRIGPANVYPDFVTDTASAIAAAQARAVLYDGDPQRMFLVGHSAGAYNLTQAVLHKSFRDAAGIDDTRIKGIVTLAGPFDFLPLDVAASINAFGHVKNLADTQPINHARADAPPFLILHGADDTTVRIKNSQSLHMALQNSGAHSELKIYPATSHVSIMLNIAKPLRNRLPVLDDITHFLASHP